MHLEFHQLDRRWEHLRVREPQRQRRLLASLADSGQQTSIVVVAAGPPDHYLLIDGHKRVAALEQLGRDTVEATVWAMNEAEAVQNFLGNKSMVDALLSRVRHYCHTVAIDGPSLRELQG